MVLKTREDRLQEIHEVLSSVKNVIFECCATENKRGTVTTRRVIEELNNAVSDKHYRIGVLIGVDEPLELQTHNKSSLVGEN